MPKIFLPLCVVLFAALTSMVGTAYAQSLTGTWAGPVTQQPASPTPYRVVIKFSETDAESDYPELNCGGRLTRVGAKDGYAFYIETITRNREKCIDGSVTIVTTGNEFGWGWVGAFRGRVYVAWSMLTRQ
jgi:hypothetical protein